MLPYADIDIPSDEELDRLLAKTKGRLFFKPGAGWLGSLLCDHRFIWDDSRPTAWCDGDTIGWNRRFFYWLTPEERVTVLAHELWHTGFNHMSRLYERCPDVWNKAADFVINLMLQRAGYVFGDKLMSLGPCLDPQYDNMSTEQVYDLLPKPPSGGNQGNPSKAPGTSAPGGQSQPQDPSQGQGQSQGNNPTQDPNAPLGGDLVEPSTQEAKDAIPGKLVKARQAAERSKEAGMIPGEIMTIIEKFLRPILPWEVLLQRFFTDLSSDDYSWKRPSRRYESEYLPSMMGENGLEHLIYYVDTSGSVSDADMLRFNSEVKHIHEDLRPKRLTLVAFDRKIQTEIEFEQDMPFNKIELAGRGGTSLDPVRRHIQKHKPTAAVIFSDLYCRPMDNPGVPVLWVIVGNDRAHPKFGQKIHIRNEPAPDFWGDNWQEHVPTE